jgi:V8-like Glu-specific endopeptidase
MSRRGSRARGQRRKFGVALLLAVIIVAPVIAVLAGRAGASTGRSVPEIGVEYVVGQAAQQATRAFWTPARMAAATPALKPAAPPVAGPRSGPPPGTPTANLFNGVPTVGALFFVNDGTHFCTASVISSKAEDLILTAAHCVVDGGVFFKNVEFVPGYHQVGKKPFGAWAVKTIYVAQGWVKGQNQNLDFAFLAVTPPTGTTHPIQQVTGALQLGINRPYRRPIEVIGYNTANTRPVECATHSFEFEANQLEFYCHDYRDGTSGGPWIVRYDSRNGTGVVIGTIGGFEQGGDFEYASYSAYLGNSAYLLYLQAVRAER